MNVGLSRSITLRKPKLLLLFRSCGEFLNSGSLISHASNSNQKSPYFRRITTSTLNMAAMHLDEGVKSLITKSYPDTNEAGEDLHKLSSLAFPKIEVHKTVSSPLGLTLANSMSSILQLKRPRQTNGSSHPLTSLLMGKMPRRRPKDWAA